MSWSGSGVFNRIYSWVADKNAGIDITASRTDADTNDITSNGFGNCLTRDGQGSASANLPMNNFRHTGVGNAAARTDYASAGQVQDGIALNWTIATGAADAIAATYTPALTALVDGQLCFFRATAANATTTPTFAPNGLTAHTITKQGGVALSPSEIAGNFAEVILRYNLANTRWELLNPAQLFQIPLGAILPFTGSTVPNANYVFPAGQAISRTTFATYFALVGTAFGVGDGVTTFNVPDLRGRGIFGLDNMGGSAANRITVAGGNFDGTVLGTAGGAQNKTIAQNQLPNIVPTFTGNALAPHSHTTSAQNVQVSYSGSGGSISPVFGTTATSSDSAGTPSGTISSINGGVTQQITPILPPAMVLPFILRVI